VIGTAIKSFHKASYNIIMRKRIHQAVFDSRKMKLNDEEKEWMRENVKEPPSNWTEWKIEFPTKISLVSTFSELQSQLTANRRRELRILHGGRMRKMQEAADEGKIGAILKSIIGKKPPFTLESIRDKGELITDPLEITRRVTKLFRDWFFRSEKDAWRDHNISDSIICDDRDKFLETTRSLNLKDEIAVKIWDSCCIKSVGLETEYEMDQLMNYSPSYEEFIEFIKNTNPRSPAE